MYSYVETGFAEPTEVILSAAFYLFVLCLPIAITYIATGLKGSLLKQVNESHRVSWRPQLLRE